MKQFQTATIALLLLLLLPLLASAHDVFYPTGTYYHGETDLRVASRGVPMVWERTYRSNRIVKRNDSQTRDFKRPVDGPLGYGWHTPFTIRIDNGDTYIAPDGRSFTFDKDDSGTLKPDFANGYTLTGTRSGYQLQEIGGNTSTFDNSGKLLTITDSQGRTTTLGYNGTQLATIKDSTDRTIFTLTWSSDHITTITDLAGRTINYSYDNFGNLTSVSHAGETETTYSYNSDHALVSSKNPLNETWTVGYLYPDKGIMSRLTDPTGKNLLLQSDFETRIYQITDFGGITRRFILDSNGNVVSDAEIANNTITTRQAIQYQPDGSRTTISDGGQTKEQRDQWGNVTTRTDAEGNITTFSYNSSNKPTTITDPEGTTTEITYDATNTLPVTITRAKGTPDQTTTTFNYDSNSDLKSTATDSASTTFTYNNAGLPTTITDPEGNTTTLDYDTIGNLTTSTDARGNKTDYSYDRHGNLTTTKDPEGNITTYSYNKAGRLTNVTDPKGIATTTTSDFAGRIKTINSPAGNSTFNYDGNGNLKTTTRSGATTTYTHDGSGRVTSSTDPEGNITTYAYSTSGGCASCGSGGANTTPTIITDPLNNITSNTLDKLGRIKQISDPLNNITNLIYDKVGRITTRTDANQNSTQYSYDKLGRIKSQTDAEGGITSFTYDKIGNLTSLTDPENNTTTFEYDKAGRKTKETRPEGQATSYSYYPNGLLKTVKDAKNQTTTYSYDKANRLTETAFNDGTKHTFQYDKNGNLTGYATPDITATITYDTANRKTAETITIGQVTKTYSYSYDSKGNKASFTSPEGITYSYTYNKNDQPKTITTPQGTITLDYTWVRNTKVTLPNGVITDFSYNGNSWLTGISAQKAAASVINATYQFDKVGNITSKANDVTTTYGYDKIYQLINSTNTQNSETFTYDKVGNRKAKNNNPTPWTYNKNNELVTAEAATYGYDANGNTTSITNSINSTNSTTIFSYNATDRLTSVQLPDGRTANYTYDPFGRRIKKQVGSDTTVFVYADEGLIGEYTAQGTATKTYGWRPNGIWGTNPVFQQENGQYYFYHNDHLGTPQIMTDVAGDIVWEATYEAFGKAIVDPNSTIASNLRFPGQYWDEETGLHFNWNRYYDSETGRYVSADPIGFEAGDENIYRYVGNDPLNVLDYTGLAGERRGAGRYYEEIEENNALINYEVRMLLNAIREIEPNYAEPATIRSTRSPTHNRDDIYALRSHYLSITSCNQCNNIRRGPSTNPLDPHNAKIRELADQIEKMGGRVIAGGGRLPEQLIRTPGGYKNGRRPDILYKDTNGNLKGINVGRVTANGRPVQREQKAQNDLNGPGGLPTSFSCYFTARKPK